tara:strand:+ start:3396 stop:4337 length:942 start_codon:yes stop_codon:yes gene_type:complete
MIKKSKDKARPDGQNEIWEREVDGKQYICERPHYPWKKLERELHVIGYKFEGKLLYGKDVNVMSDDFTREWIDPCLSSKVLVDTFTENPNLYMYACLGRVKNINKIIPILKKIELHKDSNDIPQLKEDFIDLCQCFIDFYSFTFTGYFAYDEMILRFQTLLKKVLGKKLANQYITEFLQAEITKEAIKHNAIGTTEAADRGIYYSSVDPIIFYKEPKVFHETALDQEVLLKFMEKSPENLKEFLGLRSIAPLAVQISEEGQYFESKTFLPMFRLRLEKIKDHFVKNGMMKQDEDIRDLGKEKILQNLEVLQCN